MEQHPDLTLKDLKGEISKLWFGGKEPGYVGLCLAGEGGELLEATMDKEMMPIILAAQVSAGTGKIANFLKKMQRTPEHREDKLAEMRSEIPDIKFYLAVLETILNIDPDEDWHRKMNHNERKYKRRIQDRPFVCQCEDCAKIEGADYASGN